MTTQEFSDSFDTLVSSYTTASSFGKEATSQSITFDEYEKSVFLTKAQEEIVISLYTGKNNYGDSFESSEEVRRYLAALIAEATLSPITNTNGLVLGINSKSKFFTLPSDLWFITYESVIVDDSKCPDKNIIKVMPVTQDEYQNIKDNPFRGANNRRALRLDLSEGNIEIVSTYNVTGYYVRYLKKVSPIILIDLPDSLKVGESNKKTECILHKALHEKILERAVTLAVQSKGYNLVNKNSQSPQ